MLQKDMPWDDELKEGVTHFLSNIIAGKETPYARPYDLLKLFEPAGLIDMLAKHKLFSMGSEVDVKAETKQIKKDFKDTSTPALRMHLITAWRVTVRQFYLKGTMIPVEHLLQLACWASGLTPSQPLRLHSAQVAVCV